MREEKGYTHEDPATRLVVSAGTSTEPIHEDSQEA